MTLEDEIAELARRNPEMAAAYARKPIRKEYYATALFTGVKCRCGQEIVAGRTR